MQRRFMVMAGLLAGLLGGTTAGMAREGVVPAEVAAQAQTEGNARVIVQIGVPTQPEGELAGVQAVTAQRQAIAAVQGQVLAELAGTDHQLLRQFETIPFVVLEAAPDALAALEQSAHVSGVAADRLDAPTLAQSAPLVEADQAWAAGFDGTGWAVAVLDTGVDKAHAFLTGKVVAEACFSGNSNCPNGSTTQIGSGAGVPCTYATDGCRHGTHVAGIAAGKGATFSGVARGGNLIAVQVFSRFTGANCGGGEDPCALSFTSDQVAGLEHVLLLQSTSPIAAAQQIASVNMSLGGGKFTDQASCDASNASRKMAIDNLRSVGIATAIASGNNGFTDGMSAPGCISSAVSVGSTTKTDQVSSFSNSVSFLSLLAPGSSINSSVPGGGFAVFNGTSMATPHVAGAWAILKQRLPTATVTAVLNALKTTGLPITDTRNNVVTPRIRIFRALNALSPSTTPICDVQLNKTSFVNGDTVIAQILRIANPGTTEIPVELKLWFALPGMAPIPFANVGADGSVKLPPGFTTNAGPLTLFPVTAAFPRGTYGFNCRMLHPTTGGLLTEDLNPFAIQ